MPLHHFSFCCGQFFKNTQVEYPSLMVVYIVINQIHFPAPKVLLFIDIIISDQSFVK